MERRPSHWDENLAQIFRQMKCSMRHKRWCKMSSIITVIWWLAERNWRWIWSRAIVKRRWCPRHVTILRPQQIDDLEMTAIDRRKINKYPLPYWSSCVFVYLAHLKSITECSWAELWILWSFKLPRLFFKQVRSVLLGRSHLSRAGNVLGKQRLAKQVRVSRGCDRGVIRACRHFHANLNGFLVTFSTIFTFYPWSVLFRTFWRVLYSSEWHFLSLN